MPNHHGYRIIYRIVETAAERYTIATCTAQPDVTDNHCHVYAGIDVGDTEDFEAKYKVGKYYLDSVPQVIKLSKHFFTVVDDRGVLRLYHVSSEQRVTGLLEVAGQEPDRALALVETSEGEVTLLRRAAHPSKRIEQISVLKELLNDEGDESDTWVSQHDLFLVNQEVQPLFYDESSAQLYVADAATGTVISTATVCFGN